MVPENYDIYEPDSRETVRYFTAACAAIGLCGYIFYHSFFASMVLALLSLPGYRLYRNVMAARRKNTLRIQFKDMLYSVSSSVVSGRHLGEALADSERAVRVIYGEDCIMSKEIRHMIRTITETNCSEEAVLDDFARRSGMSEVYDFADVCSTCRITGGDLARMITKAVSLMTDNLELQKEKEVLLSQKKLESQILALMPVGVTGLINITSSDYLEVMYTTAFGRLVMTVALAGTAVSFIWSMRLMEKES